VNDDTNQNSPTNTDLHTDFKLSQNGEEIALFAPDGRLVDYVRFPDLPDDLSEGRWPDGSGNIYLMTAPTPRAPNFILHPASGSAHRRDGASPGVFFALSWERKREKPIGAVQGRPCCCILEHLPGMSWLTATLLQRPCATPDNPHRFYRVLAFRNSPLQCAGVVTDGEHF